MTSKYVMLDLNDPRTADLADVISNKTSKKILDYLSDKEASETDIVQALKLPANTVNYNIRKLMKSGLIEKSKAFFWSVKGKKIPMYRVANKRIIISPKISSKLKGITGAFFATAVGAFLIKVYYSDKVVQIPAGNIDFAESSGVLSASKDAAEETIRSAIVNTPDLWMWFLAGGIFALVILLILTRIKWFR
ncbi:MAG: helix-turn-helix domain-containing protein [Candidatus Pacearchaeota archaeon]